MITQEEINNIRKICSKYDISRYSINDDGSIDVGIHVDIRDNKLTELPVKFNRVNGNFMCGANLLTTLKRAPAYVGGYFNCNNNKLTSLEGGPKYVGGYFTCVQNNLTSLQYAPIDFTTFHFGENPVYSKNQMYNIIREISMDEMKILFKYQNEYDVWNPVFNETNLNYLIEDIKDGLQ